MSDATHLALTGGEITGWGKRISRSTAATMAETIFIPATGLLMANIMTYAGTVSFGLRPNTGGRLLPITGLFFLGILLGAVVLPRLVSWAGRTGSAGRRAVVGAWLATAVAALLPGFHHYVFNEPLRWLANLFLGMAVAASYQLFFTRFPVAWRGTGFGACVGGGLVCWNILLSLAHSVRQGDNDAYHPFLPHVFTIHTAAGVILTALSIYALAIRPRKAVDKRVSPPPLALPRVGNAPVIDLMLAAFAVCFLSGILDSRLTPVLPASSRPASSIILTILAIFCTPVAGWLLDKKPELLFRSIMPICCSLFILAPSLAALGYAHGLHAALLSLVAAAQITFFVVCSVAVAGLAHTGRSAILYACIIYIIRMAAVFGHVLWTRVVEPGPGDTVLVATIMALAAGALVRRADAGINRRLDKKPQAQATSPTVVPAIQSGEIPMERAGHSIEAADGMSAFLASGRLTSREEETVVFLLRAMTARDIAQALGISERTVKKHITSIFRKFGVTNRQELHAHLLSFLTVRSAESQGRAKESASMPKIHTTDGLG